jgi:hypothetical protein
MSVPWTWPPPVPPPPAAAISTDDVSNTSVVPGATATDALNALEAEIAAVVTSSSSSSGGAPTDVFAVDDSVDMVPGPQGERGATGATGATGPQGAAGPPTDVFAVDDTSDAIPGPQGERGPAGVAGAAGPPTDVFAVDDTSDAIPGPQGERGPAGVAGAAGPPTDVFAVDDSGDTGALVAGPQGARGMPGVQGPPGDVFAVDDLAPDSGVGAFGSSQQSQASTGGVSPVQAATSAYTVPSNTLTTVPGVSFPLLANKTYVYYFDGEMSSNNALGATVNFASTFSGSSSRFLQAGILGSGNGTFDSPVNNTNGGELTASVAALATGNWPFRIHGQIDTTSAGNLTLQARRNNATVNVQLQGWIRQAN